METTQFKKIYLSAEMMDASQISTYVVENKEYSAFEVLALSNDIPSGTIIKDNQFLSSICDSSLSEKSIAQTIPSNMIFKFNLRTMLVNQADDSDIYIDWGDQTDLEHIQYTTGPEMLLSHEYANEGTFRVKIYGKKYFGFRSINTTGGGKAPGQEGDTTDYTNMICRIFDKDLPVASNVTNCSDICNGSLRILQLNIPKGFNFTNMHNITRCFCKARNLISAQVDAGQIFQGTLSDTNRFFQYCDALETSNVRLMSITTQNMTSNSTGSANYGFYQGCKKLQSNLLDLLPKTPFTGINNRFGGVFTGCENLTCSNANSAANQLWKNPFATFDSNAWPGNTNYPRPFSGCNKLSSIVPLSWGGSASDVDSIVTRFEKIEVLLDYTNDNFYKTQIVLSATENFFKSTVGTEQYYPNGIYSIKSMQLPQKYSNFKCRIDWGDGTFTICTPENSMISGISHDYTSAGVGTYVITIDNTIYNLRMNPGNNWSGTCLRQGMFITKATLGSNILNNMASINSCDFSASKITDIDIGNIKSLGSNAFNSCTSLSSINTEKLLTFGNQCLNACTSLTYVDCTSATTISKSFVGATGLQTVDLSKNHNKPTLATGTATFRKAPSNTEWINNTFKILVPSDMYSWWTTESNWKDIPISHFQAV